MMTKRLSLLVAVVATSLMCLLQHVNGKVGMRRYVDTPQQPSRSARPQTTSHMVPTKTSSTLYSHHHVHMDSSPQESEHKHIAYDHFVGSMRSESSSSLFSDDENSRQQHHTPNQDNFTDTIADGNFDRNASFKLQRTFIRIAFSEVTLALSSAETASRVGTIESIHDDNNQLLYESYIYS
ncbi:hypothetical protein FDP41_009749 [Naegleria fowleri]|uniref:Uncharacterized protein n=1 Tax=Naegleria fowleri TaxID=5763 RepID=A0A6A5AVF3_NAEFO|nr:uncharacterized protein FDP41_009749 [Naegleria fowleri]KAF0972053.1 hypothetical protein FDP41_009749 [Naegleria fowleri]